MDLKEMNYAEIKKLLTTDDKGVAAQTLQEIHSAVLKAPSRRGAALRAEEKLKKISENKIDYNENQVKKNGYSRKTANEKREEAPLPNPVRSNELFLLSSSDDSCDEDAEIGGEGHRHSEEVHYSSDNEESSNDPLLQKKKSLQEQSSDLTPESSYSPSDEDEDDEWSATDAMLHVMRRHETTLSSLPDWRKYAVPRLDLPDSEKDFEESTRKALDSTCLSCKKNSKNDCRCLARDVVDIIEKNNKKF